MIFSFAENLFSIYSTFAPLAGAGHLLLLFGKSRQKRSQGKLPENGNFPRHPRVGSITWFFYLSPLPLALGETLRVSSRSLSSRRPCDRLCLFFIFVFATTFLSFAQAFSKACSFQRRRLWSLTAVSETPLYSTQRRGAQKEFSHFRAG